MVVILAPSFITASVKQDIHSPAIRQHCTGAAWAVVAAFLGTGKVEILA